MAWLAHGTDMGGSLRNPASFCGIVGMRPSLGRVAYSPDLGVTLVDPEIANITRKAAQRFSDLGIIVEESHPDLREAHECFATLRALDFAITKAELLRTQRDLLKPEVIWNLDQLSSVRKT